MTAGRIVFLALAYYITGRLGLVMAVPPGYATVFWPASGIALGMVYHYGFRLLPGVFLGSAILNFTSNLSGHDVADIDKLLMVAASIGSGAMVQALVGTILLYRFTGHGARLERLSQIMQFLLLAGPGSCVISASWGISTLLWAQAIKPDNIMFSWWTWYTGDVLGTIIFAPLCVLLLNADVPSRRKIAVALPLLLLFAIVVIFFAAIRHWDDRHVREAFVKDTMLIHDNLKNRILEYKNELEAVHSFYDSSESVERLEFRNFVKRPLERNTGIRGMSWIPRISYKDRDAFEAKIRAEGFPDFHVQEKDESGQLVPARWRKEYYPVEYGEPFDESRRKTLGYDLKSEKTRRATLESARDLGQPVASERVRFLNEEEKDQYGFLLAIPIYRKGADLDEMEKRQKALKGFLIGAYRFKNLIEPIMQPWEAYGIQARLTSRTDKGEELLYSSFSHAAEEEDGARIPPSAFTKKLQIGFYGQKWEVTYYKTQDYVLSHINWAIWVTLAGGIFFAALCGVFLLFMTGRTAEIAQIVEERTQQLKRQRQFLELAMTATQDGVWDWDEDRKTLWLSPRWKSMLGYDDWEIPNSLPGAESVIHPQDLELWRRRMAEYMKGLTREFLGVYRFFHKGGTLRYILSRAMCERNEQGRVVRIVGSHTDITEIEQAKHDLESARDAANAANQAKSDFLANMSHEIRTPMNGVIGMTHLLMETHLDPRQRHFAQTIGHSAEALLQIINDILDFSKIEAGKLELEEIPFDFQKLCEEVAELMFVRTQEKDIEFLLSWNPGCPAFLMGDAGRLRQVLYNLCGNAVKFTERGHVLLGIECLDVTEKHATVKISVSDTGIGIPKHKQKTVFNKFDQADTSTTRKYGGTGLGLAISRQLVALMGGNIELKSELGKGSDFHFTITMERADEHNMPAGSIVPVEFSGEGLRALIVDDNPVACEIAEKYLHAIGMDVETESDSLNAIARLEAAAAEGKVFDFLILDYAMPGMDGVTLAASIQKRPAIKNICPVLVTSQPGRSDAETIRQAGIRGYLTKPLRPSELSSVLGTLWNADREGRDAGVVTRYTVAEAQGILGLNVQKLFFREVNILVAEDNPTNQEVLAAALSHYGINTVIVGDGREALRQMRDHEYDLVFMDCQMPTMDGFEATRTIRKEKGGQEIIIVAMTANVMKGDREKCIEAGMNDYVGKPFRSGDLETVLMKWLPEHKRTEAPETPAHASGDLSDDVSSFLDAAAITQLRLVAGARFGVILQTFMDNAMRLMTDIEDAQQRGDGDALARAAHSLKSSGGQIGAFQLQRLAGALEEMGGHNRLNETALLCEHARFELSRTIDALVKLLQ